MMGSVEKEGEVVLLVGLSIIKVAFTGDMLCTVEGKVPSNEAKRIFILLRNKMSTL